MEKLYQEYDIAQLAHIQWKAKRGGYEKCLVQKFVPGMSICAGVCANSIGMRNPSILLNFWGNQPFKSGCRLSKNLEKSRFFFCRVAFRVAQFCEMSVCDSVHGNRLITQGVPVNGCLRVLGSITGFPSLPITGMLWLYTRQRQDPDGSFFAFAIVSSSFGFWVAKLKF